MTNRSLSLLHWYSHHRRILPWRSNTGEKANPYHIWLSEIMLQQTTVQAVIPYYQRFLKAFPTIDALACAPQEDVLRLWAGLGYYARARNLHLCAQKISQNGGNFPQTLDALQKLPGIGAYTARAIGSIAFNLPVIAVDGNVERVTSRLFAFKDPLPQARTKLAALAATLNKDKEAQENPSDFTQALFDLGATLCTPRNPSCLLCPIKEGCLGFKENIAEMLPYKIPKKKKPTKFGAVFLLTNSKNEMLIRQRPQSGLLGGMDEFPNTEWKDTAWTKEEALLHAPLKRQWKETKHIKHVFTHFTLYLTCYHAIFSQAEEKSLEIPEKFGRFKEIKQAALPNLMKKALL